MAENYDLLQTLASEDVVVLKKKGESYGDSWKKRGGIGAFMMLARKWDRIENQCEDKGYDCFLAALADTKDADGFMDDLRDLRRYLLLVDGEVTGTLRGMSPTGKYVNQDGDTK